MMEKCFGSATFPVKKAVLHRHGVETRMLIQTSGLNCKTIENHNCQVFLLSVKNGLIPIHLEIRMICRNC